MALTIVDVVSPRVVEEGSSAPLGASLVPGGVNFSVFSKNAAAIELLLFDNETATAPARIIPLDAQANRTYHYWHACVPGLRPGQVYGYRAHGPFAPERGLRFDGEKVLLDPYGLAITVPDSYDRLAASRPGDNAGELQRVLRHLSVEGNLRPRAASRRRLHLVERRLESVGGVIPRFIRANCRTVGMTISGANGNDATTTHGATVPSSGPNGAPRAR